MSNQNQVAKRPDTPTAAAVRLLDAQRKLVESVLPSTVRGQFEWDTFRADVMQAINGSEKLQKCDARSILASVLYIMRLGLSLAPGEGKAYLVPHGSNCTPIIGAQGKIELAYRSGKIKRMAVQVAYEHDDFGVEFVTGQMHHRLPADEPWNRGVARHCWAAIWLHGLDEPLIEIMSRDEFEVIRKQSKASGSPAYTNYYNEMWRRSCLNRALKRAPKSRDLWEVLAGEEQIDAGARVTVSNTGRVEIDASDLPDLSQPAQIEQDPQEADEEQERVVVVAEREIPPPAKRSKREEQSARSDDDIDIDGMPS